MSHDLARSELCPLVHLRAGSPHGILDSTVMELLTDGTSDPMQLPEDSGARRLAVAILEQAFHDLRTGSALNQSDALCWIQEGDVGEASFNFCCEVIDWNAERIRAEVLKNIPVPKRFKNRISAANKGWLVRERADDREGQTLEAAVQS